MKKNEFVELFRKHLELSAQIAEINIGHPISRNFGIMRDSPFPNGRRISIEQAADELFISETELFRVIDLAVVEVSPTTTWVWVRESGHKQIFLKPGTSHLGQAHLKKWWQKISESLGYSIITSENIQ